MAKFLKRDATDGRVKEEAAVVVSAGVASAGKLPELGGDGKLDASVMPSGIGADTSAVQASEALAAGDFVQVWDNAGAFRVRKADGSTVGKAATGFVLAAFASGATATVYHEGQNNQLTGLTPGAPYFLSGSTPGAVTATPVAGSGRTAQALGYAVSTTTIATEMAPSIDLA